MHGDFGLEPTWSRLAARYGDAFSQSNPLPYRRLNMRDNSFATQRGMKTSVEFVWLIAWNRLVGPAVSLIQFIVTGLKCSQSFQNC